MYSDNELLTKNNNISRTSAMPKSLGGYLKVLGNKTLVISFEKLMEPAIPLASSDFNQCLFSKPGIPTHKYLCIRNLYRKEHDKTLCRNSYPSVLTIKGQPKRKPPDNVQHTWEIKGYILRKSPQNMAAKWHQPSLNLWPF